jgi:heterodisulfide reductase subunit B
MAAYLGVADFVVSPDELKGLAFDKGMVALSRPFGKRVRIPVADLCGRCLLCRLIHLVKEVVDIDVQDLGEIIEAAGAYSISAFLVFLQLLEGKVDRVGNDRL